MKKLANFLLYNNLVPVAFGVLFLGSAGALAASPDVRDVVLEANEVVRSVDNSYILNADVANYPYEVAVTQVSEDDERYYVDYTLTTIDLEDYVWKNIIKQKTLEVSKEALEGRDLAAYVSRELTQARAAERARLIETQEIERSLGVTQKVIATEYSGLIGALVPPSEEVFTEYVPYEAPVATTPDTSSPDGQVAGASVVNDGVGPTITIFGNNPAEIARGASYADLGFLALDNGSDAVATYTYVNGKLALRGVIIDTSYDATHTITYEAIDPSGNVTRKDRTVIVGTGIDASLTAPADSTASTTASSTSAN